MGPVAALSHGEVPWGQTVLLQPLQVMPTDSCLAPPEVLPQPALPAVQVSERGLENEAEEDAVRNLGLALLWSLVSDVCSTLHLTGSSKLAC